jgi:hypothetical protein
LCLSTIKPALNRVHFCIDCTGPSHRTCETLRAVDRRCAACSVTVACPGEISQHTLQIKSRSLSPAHVNHLTVTPSRAPGARRGARTVTCAGPLGRGRVGWSSDRDADTGSASSVLSGTGRSPGPGVHTGGTWGPSWAVSPPAGDQCRTLTYDRNAQTVNLMRMKSTCLDVLTSSGVQNVTLLIPASDATEHIPSQELLHCWTSLHSGVPLRIARQSTL